MSFAYLYARAKERIRIVGIVIHSNEMLGVCRGRRWKKALER